MKHTPVLVALAAFGVLAWSFHTRLATPMVSAASPQQPGTEISPLKPPPPPPGQKPGNVLEPIKTGTLSGLPAAEWYIYGLQLAVKDLQAQVKTLQDQVKTLEDQNAALQKQVVADQVAIPALQASQQALQVQFANHSHAVTYRQLGGPCGYANKFNLTPTTGPPAVDVDLLVKKPCRPGVDSYPDSAQTLSVSTPVQGAQPGSQK